QILLILLLLAFPCVENLLESCKIILLPLQQLLLRGEHRIGALLHVCLGLKLLFRVLRLPIVRIQLRLLPFYLIVVISHPGWSCVSGRVGGVNATVATAEGATKNE